MHGFWICTLFNLCKAPTCKTSSEWRIIRLLEFIDRHIFSQILQLLIYNKCIFTNTPVLLSASTQRETYNVNMLDFCVYCLNDDSLHTLHIVIALGLLQLTVKKKQLRHWCSKTQKLQFCSYGSNLRLLQITWHVSM